ncbi:MAG: glycosyltransferase family 4 protein [Burkholderiales bacterium]|nr:glycosyltransferase family 4 protein [Burkholderiales bacterium]
MIAIPAASALVAGFVIAWMLRAGGAWLAMDRPNERSLHTRPTPRTGGIGLMAGVIPGLLLAGVAPVVAVAAAFLAIVSFVDDRRGLPIGIRFVCHGLAAAAVVWLFAGTLPVIAWPLLLIAIVWMTNLYNFMDGSDGLAGGMAAIGFGTYAAAAGMAGDATFAVGCAVVSAAALAFLIFNYPPARIFMGDVGSIPLGFLAAALGGAGWAQNLWPIWFPPVVFAPFVVDASVTLLRRLLRGEKIWQAHRTHYYQRLVQLGWGHKRTAHAEYGLMALVAMAALAARTASTEIQITIVLTVCVALAVLMLSVDRAWGRHVGRARA